MDDDKECQFHLHLKYDYNMDNVDKFQQQAKTLHIYIFDENDLFVKQIEQSEDELISNMIDLTLPSKAYGKQYTFLAWVGIDYEHIVATTPVVGETALKELEVALNYERRSTKALNPLMVGELKAVVNPGQVETISLIKNTNKFRIVLRVPANNESSRALKSEDYNIYIESNNTRYNNRNEIISDNLMHYQPYYKKNDEDGFTLEISTLRIVEHRHNSLVIEIADTQKEVLKIDLNKYLEDLRFISNNHMSRQEFFDREDEFAIIIFLGNTSPFKGYAIEINGWLIREAEYDDLI